MAGIDSVNWLDYLYRTATKTGYVHLSSNNLNIDQTINVNGDIYQLYVKYLPKKSYEKDSHIVLGLTDPREFSPYFRNIKCFVWCIVQATEDNCKPDQSVQVTGAFKSIGGKPLTWEYAITAYARREK